MTGRIVTVLSIATLLALLSSQQASASEETSTSLSLTGSAVAYGGEQGETFTVVVSEAYDGRPTGKVTIKTGSTTLCIATIASDVATCSLKATQLKPAVYPITAIYTGSRRFDASTSNVLSLSVTRPLTTPVLEHSSFSWKSLPIFLQIASVGALAIFLGYILGVYLNWNSTPAKTDLGEEAKATAGSAVLGFITVSVAGASILLTGAGVLLTLEPGKAPVSAQVFTDVTIATVYLGASLICGTFSAAYVVNHIHHLSSVAEHPLVQACAAGQFVSLIFGACFFISAFFLF